MVWRLLDAKNLTAPMLAYSQLDHKEHFSVNEKNQ